MLLHRERLSHVQNVVESILQLLLGLEILILVRIVITGYMQIKADNLDEKEE